MNFRGRRKLRRLLAHAMLVENEILLHSSFFENVESDNSNESRIVDSGTSRHIGRDRADFALVSSEIVKIRGATGSGTGRKGVLRESVLGSNIPAIWYPDHPVKTLLSTDGLDGDGWKTTFGDHSGRNFLEDRRTGKIIDLISRNGLKCVNISFGDADREQGYMCQSVENSCEWNVECRYCDEPIPKDMEKSLVDTKRRRVKKVNKEETESVPQGRNKISKLLHHQRYAHMFTNPTTRCRCFDCLEVKGRKASHDLRRNKERTIENPFILFHCDFFGRIKPKSFRSNSWVLVYVCDACGYAKAEPLQSKADAPKSLVDFVREVRSKCGVDPGGKTIKGGRIVFAGIHSDNEPVLRGESWRTAVQTTGLQELHSAPFCPQMNGTCERLVGTIKSALRTSMHNVDPRAWDFCAQHISKIWGTLKSRRKQQNAQKTESRHVLRTSWLKFR